MPKKTKVRIRNKKQPAFSSGHLITSRQSGSSSRIFVLSAFIFLLLMTLMSVYALYLLPASPTMWSTFVFFAGLLGFLLMYEDNVFPNLGREKIIYFIASWFLAFLVVPYIILSFTQFNIAIFLMVVIFLIFLVPLLVRVILTQTQWLDFKSKTKDSVKTGIKKLKPGGKGKIVKGKLTGQNRKRKIYRR